jgi:hypothetical protein
MEGVNRRLDGDRGAGPIAERFGDRGTEASFGETVVVPAGLPDAASRRAAIVAIGGSSRNVNPVRVSSTFA